MSGPHEILIVEDEAVFSDALAARVRSKGWVPTVVGNARDAAKLVAERDFCGGFVDLRLPAVPDDEPLAETGFTLIKDTLRARFGRFDEKTGEYLVPLVIVSAETAPRSISRALELGGDAFVDKADLDDPTHVTDKLEERLRLAGRLDHAACARLATAPRVSNGRARMCTIVIPGTKRGSKTMVQINGEDRAISSGNFLPFLRLSAMSLRNPEAWENKALLGFGASTAAQRRLRKVFAGLLPEGSDVLEFDRSERFRWNPLVVVVDRIDWDVLVTHSDAPVRKLAADHMRKGGRA